MTDMKNFETKPIFLAVFFGMRLFIYLNNPAIQYSFSDSINVFGTLQMAKEHLEIPDLRETEFTYSGLTGYGSTREILLVLGKE